MPSISVRPVLQGKYAEALEREALRQSANGRKVSCAEVVRQLMDQAGLVDSQSSQSSQSSQPWPHSQSSHGRIAMAASPAMATPKGASLPGADDIFSSPA